MTSKNKGYQSDRPTKPEKTKKTKLRTSIPKAGKNGGSNKRRRIGE